jgi:hypothetical protein
MDNLIQEIFTKTDDAGGGFSRRAVLAFMAVGAASAAVAIASAASARGPAKGTFERTLAVSGPADITVTAGSGSIVVRSGDGSTVRVLGKIQLTSGWRQDERDADEKVRRIEANPPIEQAGGRVRIGDTRDETLRQGVSIDYEIIVPADAHLRAFTDSGSIDTQGLGGMVAETGSGSIRLQQGVPGDVEAKTGSGNIRLSGLRGGLLAHDGSGNIDVEGLPTRDWHVRSGSGNVKIQLPADAAFEVVASTGSGSVNTSRELLVKDVQGRGMLRGKANGGGPLIEVMTGSGNIEID